MAGETKKKDGLKDGMVRKTTRLERSNNEQHLEQWSKCSGGKPVCDYGDGTNARRRSCSQISISLAIDGKGATRKLVQKPVRKPDGDAARFESSRHIDRSQVDGFIEWKLWSNRWKRLWIDHLGQRFSDSAGHRDAESRSDGGYRPQRVHQSVGTDQQPGTTDFHQPESVYCPRSGQYTGTVCNRQYS